MINSTSGYSTVSSSYYLSQLLNSVSASSASSSSQTDESTADELVLSDAAQQFMSMMSANGASGGERPQGPPPSGGAPPQGPPPNGAPGDKMAQEIEEKQTSFDAELKTKLEAAGVDTEQEIDLAYDDDGNIVVTSDVSAEDKALIESLLSEDTDLAASYQELSDMTAMAAEMEERFAQGPQGPPPQGMGGAPNGMSGFGSKMSNVASAYAANSNLASNSSNASILLQQLAQTLGS